MKIVIKLNIFIFDARIWLLATMNNFCNRNRILNKRKTQLNSEYEKVQMKRRAKGEKWYSMFISGIVHKHQLLSHLLVA